MPPLPQRIEWSTGPSKHSAHEQKREDRYKHHAPRLAAHVRHGIQRNLSAEGGGFVAADFGNQGMRGFVARRREEKRHVPDKSENEKIGREVGQVSWPFVG